MTKRVDMHVNVYYDPYSRKDLEGKALLIKVDGNIIDEKVSCQVMFDGEDATVFRWVHVEELVFSSESLQQHFVVDSFSAPFVSVTRKTDGTKGHLRFDHSPRKYYGFKKEEVVVAQKAKCPYCKSERVKYQESAILESGTILDRLHCDNCAAPFYLIEAVSLDRNVVYDK